MLSPPTHIGHLIETKIREQNLSITDFAKQINVCREYVYKIFKQDTVEINRLKVISNVLNYDFIKEIKPSKVTPLNNEPNFTIRIDIENIKNTTDYQFIIEKLSEIVNYINKSSEIQTHIL